MNRINVGPALDPVMRFVGMNYDHAAAEDAWQRSSPSLTPIWGEFLSSECFGLRSRAVPCHEAW